MLHSIQSLAGPLKIRPEDGFPASQDNMHNVGIIIFLFGPEVVLTGYLTQRTSQRRNYPGWYSKVMEISPEFVIQIKFKLMFYAHKIEEREKPVESSTAQALRERFSIQATQRKSHKYDNLNYSLSHMYHDAMPTKIWMSCLTTSSLLNLLLINSIASCAQEKRIISVNFLFNYCPI